MFRKFFTSAISNQAPATDDRLVFSSGQSGGRPFAVNLTMKCSARKDLQNLRRAPGPTVNRRPGNCKAFRFVIASSRLMAQFKHIEDRGELQSLAPVATAPIRHHVFVCTGKSCSARDSAEVRLRFEEELKSRGILFGKEAKGKNPRGSVVLTECESVGFCAIGVAVMVYPDGIWYAQITPADVPEIVEEHILNGRVVERLALMRVPVSESQSVSESRRVGIATGSSANWEV